MFAMKKGPPPKKKPIAKYLIALQQKLLEILK